MTSEQTCTLLPAAGSRSWVTSEASAGGLRTPPPPARHRPVASSVEDNRTCGVCSTPNDLLTAGVKRRKLQHDRFIPYYDRESPTNPPAVRTFIVSELAKPDALHNSSLSSSLGFDFSQRILSFSLAIRAPPSPLSPFPRALNAITTTPPRPPRKPLATPSACRDAPGCLDDYYLNVLSWGRKNVLALALDHKVYLQSQTMSTEVHALPSPPFSFGKYVSSVEFSESASLLATADSEGMVRVYDPEKRSLIRCVAKEGAEEAERGRVTSLSWSGNVLSSGDKQGTIWHSDVRVKQPHVAVLKGHRKEVVGLEWRPDTPGGILSGSGQSLLASGGNDDTVLVWDGRMSKQAFMVCRNHKAAVKALAWSPWDSKLLASGGGTGDRTIHIWDTNTAPSPASSVSSHSGSHHPVPLASKITSPQITALIFSPHSRELLSGHGFPHSQLAVHALRRGGAASSATPPELELEEVAEFRKAHFTRVLASSLGPDGKQVATVGADECLKIWDVWDGELGKTKGRRRRSSELVEEVR